MDLKNKWIIAYYLFFNLYFLFAICYNYKYILWSKTVFDFKTNDILFSVENVILMLPFAIMRAIQVKHFKKKRKQHLLIF